jgi:hypothetical protein
MTRPALAVGAALLVLVAGCSDDTTSTSATYSSSPLSALPTATPSAAPAPALIRIANLPQGPPPAIDYFAGRQLHYAGRDISTDWPGDAHGLEILGVVDGHVIVTSVERFWSIDATGHVERLGRDYQWYDYSPRLVEQTGHLWVYYQDRTTPQSIWEIDARTGEEIAAYHHYRVPHGLAPADQRLVDAWDGRLPAASDFFARNHDRSLVAIVGSGDVADGAGSYAIVVRRPSDKVVEARFTLGRDVRYLSRIRFEDSRHLLLLLELKAKHRREPRVIVRCSVDDGTCERATDIDSQMALGVTRPRFVHPRRAPR